MTDEGGATPETQAPVVRQAMEEVGHYNRATLGYGRNAHCVVVWDVGKGDLGRVTALAREFARPFAVQSLCPGRYIILTLVKSHG